jgi:hypothetical protein
MKRKKVGRVEIVIAMFSKTFSPSSKWTVWKSTTSTPPDSQIAGVTGESAVNACSCARN